MLYKLCKKFAHNKVSFVGLGNMGLHMARNLLKTGVKVTGFDLNKEATKNFQKEGGEKEESIEDAFKNSDAIITMLPNYRAVSDVWQIAFKNAKKGTLLIDSSTISPYDVTSLSKPAKENGLIPSDAPVSGGVMGAQNATLSFMIGSDKEQFESIRELLKPMGKNFFYCGENSAGQIAKMCNNLCLAITMTGLSESLALGVKLGADPKVLSQVMSVSSARCWSLDTYNPVPGVMPNVPSSRDYENGFAIELMNKDLGIAIDCIKKLSLDTAILSKITKEQFEKLLQANTKKDFSYIYQHILNNKNI